MKKFIFYNIFFFSISVLISFYFNFKISWGEQWPILNNVRNIATLVFAIMGIWLGIVHPKSLHDIFKLGYKPASDLKRLQVIFYPIRNSTGIVILITLLEISSPILRRVPLFITYRDFFLNFSFSLVLYAGISLIWALMQTVIPLDDTETEFQSKSNEQDVLNEHLPKDQD